ncbi:MAG: hypothetical protein JSV80_03550, partial [Acidobacteriota bacterium]
MRGFLRRNLGLKLFSLGLAYLTWALVVGRPPVVRQVELPLVFDTNENLIAVLFEPKTIKATLTGDEVAFQRISLDELYSNIDVRNLPEGQHVLTIQASDVRGLPPTIQIDLLDSEVTLTLEEKRARAARVEVQTTGAPAEGFAVAHVRTEPQMVEITGPRSALDRLEVIKTEILDLTG